MKKEEEKLDDHHCAVIERERIKAEMAECDETKENPQAREDCHTKVKEFSKKREKACKYS